MPKLENPHGLLHCEVTSPRATLPSGGAFGFHPPHRVPDEFRRRPQFQFGFGVQAVDFDGLHTEMKLIRDVARALSLTDQLKHFEFAIRQFFNRRPGIPGLISGNGLENLR